MSLRRVALTLVALALLAAGCGDDGGDGTIVVYTSVTQNTVDAVVGGFTDADPDVGVEVFRAPTGELNARIAAERREGGIRADVLWLTDPLSMQAYGAEDLLAEWDPAGAEALDPAYRTGRFWGTRLLDLVIIIPADASFAPATWRDLLDVPGAVALPDPGFAGSAFAALGYFALTDEYGIGFYEELAAAGAVQVSSPGDVVTGVAEGRFAAGITLSFSARNAIEAGSPISIVWPEPGAIALYSPIAVVAESADRAGAEAFVEHVLTPGAQAAIGATGWRSVLDGVAGPDGGAVVTLDWSEAFDRQDELLDAYRAIFGG